MKSPVLFFGLIPTRAGAGADVGGDERCNRTRYNLRSAAQCHGAKLSKISASGHASQPNLWEAQMVVRERYREVGRWEP
ncbi:hypothetical protein BKA67DRAFT_580149 [Truncatella angustata]|uniref:Uncharacterized protein n=1 Tax=Truncatella angustata TaxID=152316 RepID=A0A9P8UBX2_9PEZI|nr:uncharacterized protein BKA67DRAFT_580149 [Truncatella angustata]KAH6646652.1 hypothetical protein BKA67DRAFT_580149 [Truncatella angustata]